MKYPNPLKAGDKVALTAPSSPVPEENLEAAAESIQELGLIPVIMPSCTMHHGYLAGPDSQRADDINNAFADKSIKGVFCLRGGYGSTRLLPLIDFDNIKANPKVFLGYSDITALHTAIGQKCGFITFHGPMPNTDYRKLDEFTLNSLKSCLFSPQTLKNIYNPEHEKMTVFIGGGLTCGPLTGGNLSLLAGTLGSPYEINTKDKILFIEDVDEELYKLDKSLTALSLAGKFKDCNGIILGTFAGCGESTDKSDYKQPQTGKSNNTFKASNSDTLTLDRIIEETVLPWNKPTIFNLRAGHIYPQSTLPMGAIVSLDLTDLNLPRLIVK